MTIRRKKGAGSVFVSPASPPGVTPAAQTDECQEAINRIVAAVKKTPDDATRLAEDIAYATGLFAIFDAAHQMKTADRDRRIKRIQKSMKKLEKLISGHPQIEGAIGKSLDFNKAESGLHRLTDTTPIKIGGRRPTPIDWLTGLFLPLIYERRFGSRANWRWDKDRAPQGGVIDFTEATLAELNQRCARRTIARAIERLKGVRKQYKLYDESIVGLM